MTAPDLTGRMARCCYDQGTGMEPHQQRYGGPPPVPSSLDLPFFEYQGPGSRFATEHCRHCGYHLDAHDPERTRASDGRTAMQFAHCPGFEERDPADEDKYYCGCWGWD